MRSGTPQSAGSGAPAGLSSEEAARRLAQHGPNELAEPKANPVLKLLGYFWGPIPWMIEAALGLSAAVRDWANTAIIGVLLLSNAAVGFWEEFQAGNAIDALKKKLALGARALRDGRWASIPARELVPGDVIRVRLGDIVPADAKLLSGGPVEVDQSALTGESLPVTKGDGETLYSGAILRQGEAEAEVTATGAATYFGKTARLVGEARTTSHFQRAVLKIGDYLIVVALVLVAVILGVALFRREPLVRTLQFLLILTVASIPVAMPTVLSVTMAVGARLLAAKEAIVSRLASIEELAGIDVLCSDKTGTLTENRLKLGQPAAFAGAGPGEVVLAGALASREEDRDPIDLAVIGGLADREALGRYEIGKFTPFDPVRKRTEAEVRSPDGKSFRVAKGAVQVVLDMCSNRDEVRSAVEQAVGEMAARGDRALGVARAEGGGEGEGGDGDGGGSGGGWRFLGVLPLFDPPRADSKATVEAAGRMGIKVKMVTGDQRPIAREISGQLGLGRNILDASGFRDTEHHRGGELAEAIEKADGFAQVFPEHKYHIVEALQKAGHIVGMTGDGVNDAPALKKADAGIAVSGATDAARAAADMVLLSPGLSVIVDAVRESRRIFERMTSYATYRIAETIRVVLFMALSIVVFDFYPVTAVMIVLLAILNDGAILSIAYDRAPTADRPRAWNMRLVLGVASLLGLLGVIETFGLFYLAERVFHLSRPEVQSLIYLKLSVSGHLTIFVTRTAGPFWSSRPSGVLLGAVTGTQLAATLIVLFGAFMAPLAGVWVAAVWGYCLFWFLVEDRVKLAARRIFGAGEPGLLERGGGGAKAAT